VETGGPGLASRCYVGLVTGKDSLTAEDACLEHAQSLLSSAGAVLGAGHPNIAYHLAALALEELGRRHLLGIRKLSSTQPVPPAWPEKHAHNHVQKLFWCFFGGRLTEQQLTASGLSEMRDLARHIHSKRLLGLYVDESEDGLAVPSEAIDADETKNLISLGENFLAQARWEQPIAPISPEIVELQTWFLTASEDPLKRQVIFSEPSLAKLAELGNTKAWGLWHKAEFQRAEAEAAALTEAELDKSRLPGGDDPKTKWKVRVRIETQSHSIRPKVLTAWNEHIPWIQLSTSSKNQLLVDVNMLEGTPLDRLWYAAWGMSRRFVVALNIATLGFWWWRMPRDVGRFYDHITDVELGRKLEIDRTPILLVDWGQNRTLSEADIQRLKEVFAVLPMPQSPGSEAYDFYVGGLTFLSLNEIHGNARSKRLETSWRVCAR